MVALFKNKKGTTVTDVFPKILDNSEGDKANIPGLCVAKSEKRVPKKIWVDKCSNFCNGLLKSCLQGNDMEMYSVHEEEKSVVAERFIRTLKNKIYKYRTSVSENACLDKLDNIVDK